MDPVCHTLVGAALSTAGLQRLTRRATATLMIAANAPDVDIVAAMVGRNLEWRRGLTHGVPALILWPFVLTAVMWLWDRLRRKPGQAPVSPRGLFVISGIGVLSHPFLDYLNSYGMRWLMPIRDRWYYGDSLFIIDPWLYLVLGLGLWFAARGRRAGQPDPSRPARVAVCLAAIYVGSMIGATVAARSLVASALGPDGSSFRIMATAVPINPLVKHVVVDAGDHYRIGSVRFGRRPTVAIDSIVPKGDRFEPARVRLAATREGRAFLHWARFPAALDVGPELVRIYDLRYTDGSAPGWAAYDVSFAPVTTSR